MAMSDAAPLLPLAESIADGNADRLGGRRSAAPAADEQAIIRQLRILVGAGRAPPQPADRSNRPPSPIGAPHRDASPAIGNWAHLALVERLGGGTFGDVYRAWDRQLEREVALKLLRVDRDRRGRRSADVAHRGGGPAARAGAPSQRDHGARRRSARRPRRPVDGADSRRRRSSNRCSERGPFSAREAALIGIDLCRALAAIHAAGLIHRDVKAQNVMREDGGRIVLMDLGTGREIDRAGRHGDCRIWPARRCISRRRSSTARRRAREPISTASACCSITSSPAAFPVHATNLDELHDGHGDGAGVRLRDARPDLPTAFVRVVDRAIALDPKRAVRERGRARSRPAAKRSTPALPRSSRWRAPRRHRRTARSAGGPPSSASSQRPPSWSRPSRHSRRSRRRRPLRS